MRPTGRTSKYSHLEDGQKWIATLSLPTFHLELFRPSVPGMRRALYLELFLPLTPLAVASSPVNRPVIRIANSTTRRVFIIVASSERAILKFRLYYTSSPHSCRSRLDRDDKWWGFSLIRFSGSASWVIPDQRQEERGDSNSIEILARAEVFLFANL